MQKNRPALFAIACAGLVVLGTIGPWEQIFFVGDISGLRLVGGWVILIAALSGASLLYWSATSRTRWPALGAVAAFSLTTIIALSNARDASNLLGSVGWGLILDLYGSIMTAVLSLIAFASIAPDTTATPLSYSSSSSSRSSSGFGATDSPSLSPRRDAVSRDLRLTPDRGSPGVVVAALMGGLDVGQVLSLELEKADGTAVPLVRGNASPEGIGWLAFMIPDLTPGDYTVVGRAGPHRRSSTALRVV